MPTWESERNHGDNGTIPTHSTTHQSSYLQYDDDDSTIESYPPSFHPSHEDSSNSEEEETAHHRNQSFDELPNHASNDISNPFRNATIPEDTTPQGYQQIYTDTFQASPQQTLRRSSRLQAIPINAWDPHTRIRNTNNHANQVALLSETAFYPNDPQDTSGYEYALEAFKDSIAPPGEPGSDPLPFLPEPNRLPQVLRLPEHVQVPWLKSFVKEIRGLIVGNNCFSIETPQNSERILPLMEVFKCKLDRFGMVDKLKCCVVFAVTCTIRKNLWILGIHMLHGFPYICTSPFVPGFISFPHKSTSLWHMCKQQCMKNASSLNFPPFGNITFPTN